MYQRNNRKLKPFWVAKAEEMDGDEGGDDSGGGGGSGGDTGADGGDDGGVSGQAYWPEDWREKYAAGDEKKLAYLGRYATPHDAFNAGISANNKITSGEFKSTAPFPVDGSDEDKAAWREANGIPNSPDGYELQLPDGMVIGEEDAPFIDNFKEFALENNLPPEAVNTAVEWYYHNQEEQIAAQEEADEDILRTNEDALRAEWGDEYRSHMNRIHAMLDMAPEGVKEKLMAARYHDGTPLGSDNDTLKWLLNVAMDVNPMTTVLPSGGDMKGSVADEMAEIRALMKDDNSKYWKGPEADNLQKRYRELLEWEERQNKNSQ